MSRDESLLAEIETLLRQRWRVWLPVLIVVPLLWAGLNAQVQPWIAAGSPLSFSGLRAFGPFAALLLGLSLLLFAGGWRTSREDTVDGLPVPLILFAVIGLLGVLVGLARSPDLVHSVEWGLAFLAVPTGFLALYALGPNRVARPALLVTSGIVVVITTVLLGFAIVRFDILSLGLSDFAGRPFIYGDYEPIAYAFLINANGAARFAAVSGLIVIACALCTAKRWARVALLVPGLLLTLMVVETQSRSGLIGFAVAAGLILILAYGLKRASLLAGVAMAVLALAGGLPRMVSTVRRGGVQDLWTFSNRDHIWADGLQAIATNPIFGWGFETDRLIIGEHLHQAWLQTWFQTGLVGLALFAIAWLLTGRSVYRTLRSERFVPTEQPVYLSALAVFLFLLLRSIPESTGAFYGVDLLLLAPIFGYFWTVQHEFQDIDESGSPEWRPTTPLEQLSRGRTVLVCAFACRPPDAEEFGGGEDMLGWSLVSRLAEHHHLHVLTCASNRAALKDRERTTEHGSLTFHYVDVPLPGVDCDNGRRRGPIQVYAYLWQVQASRVARTLNKELDVDLYHHLTYANDWMASHASVRLDRPIIRGPGGSGPRIPGAFLSRLPVPDRAWESVRMLGRPPFRWDPFFIAGQAQTHRLLVCNHEAMQRLPPAWQSKAEYFPVIGITDEDLELTRNGHQERLEPEPFTVVTAGKQLPSKGFEWALRAFARFHETAPESRFVLVGDGPDRPRLEALAGHLGIGDAVTFTGWLPTRDDVLEAMAQGHAFLYPSLHDGGGAVVLEGMACGLPPIVFDLGGPGLHVDESYGYRIDPEDPEVAVQQMTEALTELHDDPKHRLAMAQAARDRVTQAYRWDVLTHRMLEVYDDAIANGW